MTRLLRPFRPLVPLATVLLGGMGLAACGTTTVSTDEVESTITRQFAAQGARLTDVSCEDGVKAEVGEPVRCTAKNPAQTTLVLEGQVTAVDGDKASFRVKAVRGVARGPVIAAQAKRLIEQRVGQTARSFTCPAEVPIPTRPDVTCRLTAQDGTTIDARVSVDAQSRIQVQVADAPGR